MLADDTARRSASDFETEPRAAYPPTAMHDETTGHVTPQSTLFVDDGLTVDSAFQVDPVELRENVRTRPSRNSMYSPTAAQSPFEQLIPSSWL